MKKLLWATAAFVAAVAVLVAFGLPPARLTLETPFTDGTVPGVFHVHTNRSDGRSSPDDVAAAAARAGLKFVILTDHGDATRTPDPPAYRSGVLCIDAVEISTAGGHYLALDMPPSPYPLSGEPAEVVEDVRRLGGFGVVAHPNSPKSDLAWRDWSAPFDGVEWLNPDTSWRLKAAEPGVRARLRLASGALAYPFRPPETIAHVMGETSLGVERWRSFARKRRVVLMAGVDAHARLQLASDESRFGRFALPVPGYEASFRTMSTHVRVDRPLTGEASRDATTILQAVRRGRLYTAIDGVATPPAFEFSATNARGTAQQGDALETGGPVMLRVRSNAPSSFQTILWQDDEPFATMRDQVDVTRTPPLRSGQAVDAPAIYRATIVSPPELGSLPWIISNPIYVGVTFPAAAAPAVRPVVESRPLFDGKTTKWWRTETDPTSLAAFDMPPTPTGGELRFRFGLSGGTPNHQYASLGVELPNGAAPFDRVTFTARTDQPMRITVQLQPLGRAEGWQRTVYVDEKTREYRVYFDEVLPMEPTKNPRPDAARIHDILFVVDTAHAKPGVSGFLWITKAALQR